MSIQKAVWSADIKSKIFADNSFLMMSRDDTAFADGRKVYLPQAGAVPNVVRNRTTLPAGAAERTDTVVDYDLDSFTTDPTNLRNIDELETSYDKRMSILQDHVGEVNEKIAEWMINHWSPTTAGQQVRTTGANRDAFVTGGTGLRKKITVADLLKAKRILDNQNVASEGRCLLIPAEMYNDLLEISDVLTSDKMGTANLVSGAVGRILGFQVFIRSQAGRYTNAATPAAVVPTTAGAATHNAAALLWGTQFVRRAKGDVTVFAKENDPQFYGSVFSAEIRAGGRKAYADGRGVVAIIEEHGTP